jgi:hypothetical protein
MTIYEEAVNKYLIPSLKKLDLDYYIFPIESLGQWRQNAIQKPLILKEALIKFPEHDIIWEDADSEILQYPELLFNIPAQYDVAVHYLDWEIHYGWVGKEMLDGTVYWQNSEKVRTFIDNLILLSTNKGIDHQKTMASMLENNKDMTVFELPREYSYITSKPNGDKPVIEIENPIIVHHQLSREAKRKL